MAEYRRAVVFLGADTVARTLALPEGLHVVAISDDFVRNGVRVLVEGESLDPVPENVEAPRLEVSRLDRTELAMQAVVLGWDRDDGDNVEVHCPVTSGVSPINPSIGCAWSRECDRGMSLAALADAVQQHLAEAHSG